MAKRSLQPWDLLRPPRDDLAQAAAWLDRSEAEVLALAHRWWFGAAPAPAALDRLMAAYMFRQETPAWARQFARQVCAPGATDPATTRRLGLDRLSRPAPPQHGKLIVSATVLAAVLMLLLAVQLHVLPSGASARPSCAGGGPGLAFLEEVAYGLAGRQSPDC